MTPLSYDSVEALIYDPVSANRTVTRAALYALGFRHTDSVSTMDAFLEAIQKRRRTLFCARRKARAKSFAPRSRNCARAAIAAIPSSSSSSPPGRNPPR